MKPHIYFNYGYWRVSAMPKPYRRYQAAWDAAHAHVRKLNANQRPVAAFYIKSFKA